MKLYDLFYKPLTPLFRLKPAYTFRDGIYSPLQRSLFQGQDSEAIIYTERRREEDFFKNTSPSLPTSIKIMYVDSAAEEEHVFPITPWNHFLENIDRDLSFWKKPVQSLRFLKKKGNLLQGKSIYVHESAQVFGASLDATDGPVVIDAEAKISSFCHLKGPLYIGEKTQVDMAFLSNCVIGENCRIGGEVADSLISNYTNKHHEGFVGHSILGSWANLGALTTTSDLKNNYRPVKLLFQKQEFPTGELKYGSILGDFVKTSIGTMLNTGTVIDLGVLLPPKQEQKKYYPPFSWGGYPDEFYELQKFFRDIETMMQRRNQVLTAFLKDELAKIYALNFRA